MLKRVVLVAAVGLALAAPAAAESRRTKHRLAAEEAGVKDETAASRVVAAKEASSFDSEMSKLNAEPQFSSPHPQEKAASQDKGSDAHMKNCELIDRHTYTYM